MAARKKKQKSSGKTGQKPKPPKSDAPAESRVAEIATVGWMLLVITTLCCMVGSLGAFLLNGEDSPTLSLLTRFFWLSALVAGVLSLAILPAVWQARQAKPPRPIVIASVVIALIPVVPIALDWMRG